MLSIGSLKSISILVCYFSFKEARPAFLVGRFYHAKSCCNRLGSGGSKWRRQRCILEELR